MCSNVFSVKGEEGGGQGIRHLMSRVLPVFILELIFSRCDKVSVAIDFKPNRLITLRVQRTVEFGEV